ncbi:HD domain-containing phosphohydrolase [Aminipila terrae]
MQLKSYFEEQSKAQLVKDSQNISDEIEMFLQKYIVIVDQAKNNPDFINIAKTVKDRNKKRENPLYNQVTKELKNISDMDKNIALSYIALPDTDDLITNDYNFDITSDYDLTKRQWYIDTLEEGKTTITAPYLDVVSGKMAITVGAPIVDKGKVLGTFALDIMIEDIDAMMRDYKIGKHGYAVLLYDNGHIIYHPDIDTVNPSKKVFIQDYLGHDLSKKLLSGKKGITSYTYQGQKKFIAYVPIANTNLIVLTVIPKSEVFLQLNKFLSRNLFILIGLVIAVGFILNFFKKYISSPVVKICREIDNYSHHNKSIALPPEYLLREDEIGILSNGLTYMIEKISNYLCEIESKNQELLDAKEEISIERSLFKTTIHSLGDGVISTDECGRISIMNKVAEDLTGWTVQEAKGQDFKKVFYIINELSGEQSECPVTRALKEGHVIQLADHTILIKRNGEKIAIEDSAAPIMDETGNITGAVIVFRDFTEKKQKQEQILYLSYHDHLTGLYNRRFFEKELYRLDQEKNMPFSIAMIDVNGLKLTNDAFGHSVGDELLKRVAKVLTAECNEDNIIARIGGDEFIILLPHTSHEEAEKQVKRIYKATAKERVKDIVISISIGFDTKLCMGTGIENTIIKAEEQMYMKKITESQSMRNKTIQAIFNTLNEKNERERIHSEKVSKISREIGEIMNLDEDTVNELETSGLMHDIGKIIISEDILNKPGKLTESEYREIKRHSECGYQILRSVDAYSPLAENVLYHHERWDGKGYPRGLRGRDIPLLARIITIADAYEAMTAKRPYKKPLTVEAAVNELVKNSGTQFDPQIVELFVKKILGYRELFTKRK